MEPGTRRGLDQFGSAVEKVVAGWARWEMTPERLESGGGPRRRVVRYRARGWSSGAEIEGRESALWTFRDGKVVRYEWFHGPEDAFRAAGLKT